MLFQKPDALYSQALLFETCLKSMLLILCSLEVRPFVDAGPLNIIHNSEMHW